MSEQSGFQLSGSAPEMYERYIVAPFCVALAENLVSSATLNPGEHILDVACGTGVVTRRAAQDVGPTGAVTGLDINEGMLSMARSISSPNDDLISYREGSAIDIPFPDETFDAVFCQHGLEFFPDRGQGVSEMRRVLKPKGQLGLRVWRHLEYQPFHIAVLAALDRHLWREQDVPSRAGLTQPFSFGDAEALRALAVDAGFSDIEIKVSTIPWRYAASPTDMLGYLSALPFSRDIHEMDEIARNEMLQELLVSLQPFLDGEELVMPGESHIVLARK